MRISDWSSDVCSSDLAIFQTLAGQHALEAVGDALVLAEHIADLAAADTDVACGDVDIGADMSVELGHEALATAHDPAVALALGIEVRATLAAAPGPAGQRVLEGLLDGAELQHALRDRRMEADAALLRAAGAVVMAAPAPL